MHFQEVQSSIKDKMQEKVLRDAGIVLKREIQAEEKQMILADPQVNIINKVCTETIFRKANRSWPHQAPKCSRRH
jgi:hypothetical protein